MNAAIAHEQIPDLGTEIRETTRRIVMDWLNTCDRILDLHRSNFVFRLATPKELEQHEVALSSTIRTCNWMHAVIADPQAHEPGLASRLRIRIQQLQDAYYTFHDPTLSDDEAERILSHVFPK